MRKDQRRWLLVAAYPASREAAGLRARVGAALLLAGAGLGVLGLSAPATNFRHGYALGVVATVGAAVAGVVAWVAHGRLPRWAQDALALYGVGLITVATLGGGPTGSSSADNEVLYLLPVLYASYFSSRRTAAAVLASIAAAYLGVMLADSERSEIITRWVTTVGSLSVASVLVMTMRDQMGALVRELEAQARSDPLTGLANRRAFLEALEAGIARSNRTAEPLSVVLCDLDGLKALNDRGGHVAGDAALRSVAAALRTGRRETDLVARLGGDEFALLLPGCRPEAAVEAAERARRALAAQGLEGGDGVTVSFGVAGVPDHGRDADVVLAAADRALYRAKAEGRDRTVTAPASLPAGA